VNRVVGGTSESRYVLWSSLRARRRLSGDSIIVVNEGGLRERERVP